MKKWRRNFISQPGRQLQLSIVAILPTICALLFNYIQSFSAIDQIRDYSKNLPQSGQESLNQVLKVQESILGGYFFWTSLVSISIATLAVLYISNKLVGPLNRITTDLKKINDGEEIKEIKIRKSDHLHELEFELNRFLKTHKREMKEEPHLKKVA